MHDLTYRAAKRPPCTHNEQVAPHAGGLLHDLEGSAAVIGVTGDLPMA